MTERGFGLNYRDGRNCFCFSHRDGRKIFVKTTEMLERVKNFNLCTSFFHYEQWFMISLKIIREIFLKFKPMLDV